MAAAKSKANLSGTAKPKAGSLIRDEKLKALYKTMLQCRALEARAGLLSQQDRLPSWSTAMRGQEAIEVGCAIDLRAGDCVASANRDYIFKFIRGLPLGAAITPSPTTPSVTPSIIMIGRTAFEAHNPFAMGVSLALANRSKKTCGVVVAFSKGDSASQRSWDEILNLAGARCLPILFVAQSLPRRGSIGAKKRARVGDPSSQSQRHGVPGIPVDGNDVVAVYRVAQKSLERARLGGGPTLMECKNWPCDEYEADGRGRRSRSRESDAQPGHDAVRQTHDPIRRMEEYLLRKGLFSETWKNRVAGEFARELDAVFTDQANRSC